MTQGRHPPRGPREAPSLTLLFLLLAVTTTTATTTQGDGWCCSLAPPTCRAACYRVPLWGLGGRDAEHHLTHLASTCPHTLDKFWTCLNNTMAEVTEGAGWWGRPCCKLALAPSCQAACLSAGNSPQLGAACRASHEIEFFRCIQRTEEGAGCCARTQSYRCRASCEAVFTARTPSRRLRHQLAKDCRAHAHVTRCAHSLTKTTPAHRPERNLHCCAASEAASCRLACRRVLTSSVPQQDILEQLEAACGTVDLTNGVWKCLFQQSEAAAVATSPEVRQVSRLGQLGLDAAKLGCCQRAASPECGSLCRRAFSREWGRAWETLQTACLSQPREASLLACLSESDVPCQQGCSGLAFCTNFNHRPTQLFRSCTARADAAAREDLQLWQKSQRLSLPGLAATVPLRNVKECQPELWRAVACALHLRPCHVSSLTNAICWHDCVKLLSRCVAEPEGGPDGSLTAGTVCGAFSPPPGSPCVSLTPFLTQSEVPNEVPWRVPTSPCRPFPCPARHVCSVNSECRPGEACRPYSCTPACTMGEVSSVTVPVGAYISVHSRTGESSCGQVCACGRGGVLESCRFVPCVDPAPCWLGTSKIDHDTEMVIGCRVCVCHAGELTCLPRPTCHASNLLHALPPLTGLGAGAMSRGLPIGGSAAPDELPCGCPDHWVPVCANNGQSFPSECLARCAGVGDGEWVTGECGARDGCDGVRCDAGQVCVSVPNTCLTLPSTPCPQHICVPTVGACPAESSLPACDTRGRQFESLCDLVRAGTTLRHLGTCSTRCSSTGEVCGRDGRTWASECHAHANRVPVDYVGPCRGVGVPGREGCPGVVCPGESPTSTSTTFTSTSERAGCLAGVSEAAWCCGRVCGGALRLAWSSRAVEVAGVALPHRRPLTVTALLNTLASNVGVSECEVRGHLTLDGHLLVLVTPTAAHTPIPPPLVSEACVVEAERLVGVVRARSPRLMSTLPASALTLAVPAHTSSSAGGVTVIHPFLTLLLVILVSIVVRGVRGEV